MASTLVPLRSLARLEHMSTDQARPLALRKFSHFRRFPISFMLRRTAMLLCKTLLLLLGIIGLAATHLKFEEGQVTLLIQQL